MRNETGALLQNISESMEITYFIYSGHTHTHNPIHHQPSSVPYYKHCILSIQFSIRIAWNEATINGIEFPILLPIQIIPKMYAFHFIYSRKKAAVKILIFDLKQNISIQKKALN